MISNEKGINGAASMLYENELHELAESFESDLYILPSSVHEVIAVSSDMGSPEMLAQMVVEVNMQEVSLDERLSNQVYHYDKDLRKLTLATVSYTHLDVYKRQIYGYAHTGWNTLCEWYNSICSQSAGKYCFLVCIYQEFR